MTRLVFIESAAEMGGVEFSTLYLASHLDRRLWDVTVICPSEGSLASSCRAAGVAVRLVPLPRLLSTSFRVGHGDTRLPNPFAWAWNLCAALLAASRLRRCLLQTRPQVVVTKGIYAHFSGGMAARCLGIDCVWHLQDFISERFWGIQRRVFGLFSRFYPRAIVVDGTPIAHQLPRAIQQRVTVLLNGIDTALFHPGIDGQPVRSQFGISPEDLVLGHAARLTPWKGQHYLLEAFAVLAPRYPGLRLLLVGSPLFDNDAYERRLRARVTELGLGDRVIFTGFRRDLPQVLAAMDVFAHPSVEKDTSPLALLSAMAAGLPVAAFDIDGVREVLLDDGLLVPVGNIPLLASAIERLVVDAELRERLGGRSRAAALARFSLERHIAGMQAVLASGQVE